MKSTRIKAPAIEDAAAFQAAIDELARLTVQIRGLEAARDRRLQAVRAEHEPAINALEEERERLILNAEKYATAHRAELFPAKAKSADTALARFGFALANKRSVKPVNKKIEEATIIGTLKANHLEAYVRTIEEIAKDKILADGRFDDEIKADVLVSSRGDRVILAEVGLKFAQGEVFFVEPKDAPQA